MARLYSSLTLSSSLRALQSQLESAESLNNDTTELLASIKSTPLGGLESEGSPDDSHQVMPRITARLGRHFTCLLILRAGIRPFHSKSDKLVNGPSTTSDHRSNLLASMKDCVEGFSDFIKNLKTDDATGYWPPWCQTAFSSLCFTLLLMGASSPTFEDAFSWFRILQSTRRYLRLKANSLPALRLGLLRIDSIFWRGVDKVLKLEPHAEAALRSLQEP